MEKVRKRLAEISSISLELKPTEIIKLSKLIEEASEKINPFKHALSSELDEAVEKCKESSSLTEKQKFSLFQESRNLLNINIGKFIKFLD
jgi:archaellum component FlaC